MIKISHRGNICGPIASSENKPEYIDFAISQGYDVEIDLRVCGGDLFLGHDEPEYNINLKWLQDRSENLWIHAKDFNSLDVLGDTNLVYFFHDVERYVLISNGLVWCHDIVNYNSMSVIPLICREDTLKYKDYNSAHGICSDYVKYIV